MPRSAVDIMILFAAFGSEFFALAMVVFTSNFTQHPAPSPHMELRSAILPCLVSPYCGLERAGTDVF